MDEQDQALVQQDRFVVTVEVTVNSDSIDDAEEDVKEIIQRGIISMIDEEDREPIREFDITDTNPAEVF